jgi:sulfide:quinone oxidoreductase
LSWFIKEKLLPPLYWYAMLKGHEWLAAPDYRDDIPTDRHAKPSCNFEAS